MVRYARELIFLGVFACLILATPTASRAQDRYEPARPTVSPYLNLFQNNQNNRNGVLQPSNVPNYYTLVRPLQQQQQFQQSQTRLAQQQAQTLQKLQYNLNAAEQRQAAGPLVVRTGTGSKFDYPGSRYSFLNTDKYYPQTAP